MQRSLLTLAPLLAVSCTRGDDATPAPETGTEWHEPIGDDTDPSEPTDTSPRTTPAVQGQTNVSGADQQQTPSAGQLEPEPEPTLRFAVIGDFGTGDDRAAEVAALVHSWSVDFVLTVGDNNYHSGEAETLEQNVGRDWHSYIHPYLGEMGPGATENRFWPCPGNHDYNYEHGFTPYTDYFTLPGNERYYEHVQGPAHFFCVNSDSHEPDSFDAAGPQALWLQAALAASTSSWKIVYQHHPPWSSGVYGPDPNRQWPFAPWGADLVLSGHEHDYERLVIDGLSHVITGVGGTGTRSMGTFLEGSQAFWTNRHGAVLVELSDGWARFRSLDTLGAIGDQWYDAPGIDRNQARPVFAAESAWHYLVGPAETPAGWTVDTFDDAAWSTGQAPIGVGADIRTELEDAGGVATVYMRSAFQMTDADDVRFLVLRLRRDDGVVLYLNGQEIYRVGMVDGETPSSNTPAAFEVEDGWEGVYSETLIWPTALQQGRNQLAMEVHRFGGDDPDLFADLELGVIDR